MLTVTHCQVSMGTMSRSTGGPVRSYYYVVVLVVVVGGGGAFSPPEWYCH